MTCFQTIHACFPLTLTLSPAEREQPLAAFLKFVSNGAEVRRGFAKTLETILPLPAGEGRGEGTRGSKLESQTNRKSS